VADVQTSVLERVDTEVARSIGANPDLLAARDAVERMRREDDAAERVIAENAGSVCLVQGAYGFGREVDGKWRYLREASDEMLKGLDVSGDRVPLMLEGDGPLFRIEYTGTGFLADATGIVLTNRHIAQPWWNNEAADPLLEDGFEARFFYLRACFPGRPDAVSFDLERTLVSNEADLAALRFEPKGELPPPLRLADPSDVAVGRRVILLGYPSGLNALIARSDEDFTERFTKPDFDSARILDELAKRDLVRPLPTQGYIGDIVGNKMLFDAPTAGGGSGAPLFDLQGRVVAVNYGILKAFSGANFGVPVRYAGTLIESARSK
jgi:S1-C subfamily serine protease